MCLAAGSAHIVEGGSTTVVNATAAQSSGKLTVTHVVSHLDVVRLLAANQAKLGGWAEATLEQLGLDEGAVFCVPATTPALEAFARMAQDHKSCLGLTDASGKLVRAAACWGGCGVASTRSSAAAPEAATRHGHPDPHLLNAPPTPTAHHTRWATCLPLSCAR